MLDDRLISSQVISILRENLVIGQFPEPLFVSAFHWSLLIGKSRKSPVSFVSTSAVWRIAG